MVVASRPSQPNRTYHRRSPGPYSTCWTYSAAATGPSRWRAISSWASARSTGGLRALHRGAGREVAVQAPQPGGRDAPHVPARADERARAHRRCELAMREQHIDRRRVVGGGAALDEKPRVPVVDDGSEPPDIGGDDRRPAGRGLQRDETERLRARRDEAHVGRLVVRDELVVRLGRDEPHLVPEAQVGDELPEGDHLRGAVRPARASDDEQRYLVVEP